MLHENTDFSEIGDGLEKNFPDLPESIRSILNDCALIDGESADSYDDLMERCQSALKPTDMLELIWLKDFVDNLWEGLRLRRLRAADLNRFRVQGMASVLESIIALGEEPGGAFLWRMDAEKLAKDWQTGDPDAVRQVENLFHQFGFSLESVLAAALHDQLSTFERLDRLIDAADRRRNRTIKELLNYRAAPSPAGLMAL